MRSWIVAALVSLPACAQPVEMPKPNYCFGFLNAVANRPQLPQEEVLRIQKEHLAHLGALAEKRWLVAAGPILTPGGPRGLLISRCRSVAEANELASADPAVKNRRLWVESYLWTGPDGIGDAYWKGKEANPQAADRMLKHSIVFLRKGASWSGWPAKEVLEAHFANVRSLKKATRLVAAGPLHDGGARLGVFVFEETAIDEARRLVEQDPLVAGGHASVEAYEWLVADGVFPKAAVVPSR